MECPICYTSIKNEQEFVILNCECKNSYHKLCIEKWHNTNNSCPTCRKKWPIPKFKRSNKPVKKRRNAITPELARILTDRLFLESIGINSSNYSQVNT